jgi:hypothetical protein
MSRFKLSMPILTAAICALAFVVATPASQAKGCLKGAAVGGVAGHVAGHHAVLGAAAGCAVGHHIAKKKEQQQREKSDQPQKAQPGAADSRQI